MAKKRSTAAEQNAEESQPEQERNPILFSVGCQFGRAGIGSESGSISVKFPDGVLSDKNRGVFIQNSLLVTISSDPTPPSDRQQKLPGTEDAFEERTLHVSAKRISVGANDVGVTLTFDKQHVSADFLSSIASRAGSLIVHKVLAGE